MRKVPLPESDSDHMHRCAMCALLLSQPADPRDDYSGEQERFHPNKAAPTRGEVDGANEFGFSFFVFGKSRLFMFGLEIHPLRLPG